MLDRLDDTIAAISSAPGFAPLGIVRLSGDRALVIVSAMARTESEEPFGELPGFTRVRGTVRLDADLELPADFFVFRAPRSYTRQDLVEVHTIGSPAVLEMVRRRMIALGARQAEPGEFTARAFVHGTIGLVEAEAVAAVIRARSDTQLRAGRRMMDGAVSRSLQAARDVLGELLALVEAGIDFAEEPIEFITPDVLRHRLRGLGELLAPMLRETSCVERFDQLPRILLFGAPNVGKSSLMNRLSGVDRSICAAAAGTTRDLLSAPIRLDRSEAILLDSAGVDESLDEVIASARSMTLSAAERVDLVCFVVDVTGGEERRLLDVVRAFAVGRVVVAANKCDRLEPGSVEGVLLPLREWDLGSVCAVSALTGGGIEELRTAFASALSSADSTAMGEAVLLTERQRTAVIEAHSVLSRAMTLLEGSVDSLNCADVLAFELREALDHLGSVTGEVPTEELLGQIFSRFCIGK